MSEIKRKLSSLRTVDKVTKHPNADNLDLASVGGWNVVTQKDWVKENDLVVFFEIDSFLPLRPEYEWLRKSSYRKNDLVGEGYHLRTIKLRGIISQGLIVPVNEALEPIGYSYDAAENAWVNPAPDTPILPHAVGTDLTSALGVKKFEKPVPLSLTGKIKGAFPSFVPKTDQERAQNLIYDIEKMLDEVFEVTLKLDGTSMTVFLRNDLMGVCGRNWEIAEDILPTVVLPTQDAPAGEKIKPDAFRENMYWRAANEEGLRTKIRDIKADYGFNLALQGELMGPSIQGNRERLPSLTFFVFDIFNIDTGEYVAPPLRREICLKHGLNHVPVIEEALTLRSIVPDVDHLMTSLLKYAARPSFNPDKVAEGVVLRLVRDPKVSFKIINNEFLLEAGNDG